jgi:hypothetical protein
VTKKTAANYYPKTESSGGRGDGEEREAERDINSNIYTGTPWLKHIFPTDKARNKEAKTNAVYK